MNPKAAVEVGPALLACFAIAALAPAWVARGQAVKDPPQDHSKSDTKIIFVCDASDSIVAKMPVLRDELADAVGQLREVQSFNIIFMREKGCAAFAEDMVPATAGNKQRANEFISRFTPGGQTDPIPAMSRALRQTPSLIYLLADRDFSDDEALLAAIRELNRSHGVTINTIALKSKKDESPELDKRLAAIASESGGTFKMVLVSDLEKPGSATRPAGSKSNFMFDFRADCPDAREIIFVCDCSGSMLNKFATLRRALTRAVDRLGADQCFNLVFFQETKPYVLSPKLLKATKENKLRVEPFLENAVPRGETNPIPGIKAAFNQHPQAIYLLTDGDFPNNDAVIQQISLLNKDHQTKVNAIAFIGEGDNDTEFLKLLKQIAHDNGGVYHLFNESDVARSRR
jgi:hypothetical protein